MVSVDCVLKGLSLLQLTIMLLNQVLQRQGFPSSACQAVLGQLECPQERLPAVFERTGYYAWEDVPNNAISALNVTNYFCFIYLGLDWFSIPLISTMLLFCFFGNHQHHKAWNNPITCKLLHHFYLQFPACKIFWSLKWSKFVIIVRSRAVTSSLTNFKLAWKIAALLTHVIAKWCNDLPLMHTDTQ